MMIKVRTLTGKLIEFDVEPADTVRVSCPPFSRPSPPSSVTTHHDTPQDPSRATTNNPLTSYHADVGEWRLTAVADRGRQEARRGEGRHPAGPAAADLRRQTDARRCEAG